MYISTIIFDKTNVFLIQHIYNILLFTFTVLFILFLITLFFKYFKYIICYQYTIKTKSLIGYEKYINSLTGN